MPLMTIRSTNSSFESISNQAEYPTLDDAYRAAIRSGLAIAGDEVANGAESSIVEVAVDLVGERYAARGAVAVSTARILNRAPDASDPAER